MQEIPDHYYSSANLNFFSEKIEGRIRDLHCNRQIIISINNIEEFILYKMKLTQFFFDLEDELRDLIQKYKSLFLNNKGLTEKNNLLCSSLRSLEAKDLTNHRLLDEYRLNINDLLNQIGNLKEKHYDYEYIIKSLEEKHRILEKNLSHSNNSIYLDKYLRGMNESNEKTMEDVRPNVIIKNNNENSHSQQNSDNSKANIFKRNSSVNPDTTNTEEKTNINKRSLMNNTNININTISNPNKNNFVRSFLHNLKINNENNFNFKRDNNNHNNNRKRNESFQRKRNVEHKNYNFEEDNAELDNNYSDNNKDDCENQNEMANEGSTQKNNIHSFPVADEKLGPENENSSKVKDKNFKLNRKITQI